MMRSLYSGVSGLRVHQTKMDVIGNNISNVNTIGFKGSSVNFSDILYQNTQSATGPNAQTGMTGQNARQIGLGASIASIKTQMTVRGGAQRTDNAFDMMINDDSFFIVNNGSGNYFTKAGSFETDAAGTLCTSDGSAVMGWKVDPTDPTRIMPGQVSPLDVMSAANMTTPPEYTTKTNIVGNIDKNDPALRSAKGSPIQMQFYDNIGNLNTAKLRVKIDPATADLPTVSYTVEVEDVLGSDGNSIFVQKVDTNGVITYVPKAGLNSGTLGGAAFNLAANTDIDQATGKVLNMTNATPMRLNFNGGTGEFLGSGTAAPFSKDEQAFVITGGNGLYPAAPGGIGVDYTGITQHASNSGVTSLEGKKGGKDYTGMGKPVGKMSGIGVDQSGKIFGNYDNGDKKLLGQIAVASFANPAGLEAIGSNRFAATQNSGDFDGIGKDISTNGGKISSGVVEMSNVDLSQQFTDMITTQRGFQANSRIITTSDTLLEELINLKR